MILIFGRPPGLTLPEVLRAHFSWLSRWQANVPPRKPWFTGKLRTGWRRRVARRAYRAAQRARVGVPFWTLGWSPDVITYAIGFIRRAR